MDWSDRLQKNESATPGQGNRALENGTQNTASYQAAESERQAAILIGSDAAVYEAYPIKRHRSTKREVWQRRLHLYGIVHKMRPMTVRQVFYQATVHEIVEKTDAGYAKVQTDLVVMRKDGMLPYDWIADNTRWQRKPETFSSVEQALQDTARFYRKALWADADAYVEVWLEKDALAGVVYPVTLTCFCLARAIASSIGALCPTLCARERRNMAGARQPAARTR